MKGPISSTCILRYDYILTDSEISSPSTIARAGLLHTLWHPFVYIWLSWMNTTQPTEVPQVGSFLSSGIYSSWEAARLRFPRLTFGSQHLNKQPAAGEVSFKEASEEEDDRDDETRKGSWRGKKNVKIKREREKKNEYIVYIHGGVAVAVGPQTPFKASPYNFHQRKYPIVVTLMNWRQIVISFNGSYHSLYCSSYTYIISAQTWVFIYNGAYHATVLYSIIGY